jgi:hypothetical protein
MYFDKGYLNRQYKILFYIRHCTLRFSSSAPCGGFSSAQVSAASGVLHQPLLVHLRLQVKNTCQPVVSKPPIWFANYF